MMISKLSKSILFVLATVSFLSTLSAGSLDIELKALENKKTTADIGAAVTAATESIKKFQGIVDELAKMVNDEMINEGGIYTTGAVKNINAATDAEIAGKITSLGKILEGKAFGWTKKLGATAGLNVTK